MGCFSRQKWPGGAAAWRILLAVTAVMLGAAASPGLAASSSATSRTSTGKSQMEV